MKVVDVRADVGVEVDVPALTLVEGVTTVISEPLIRLAVAPEAEWAEELVEAMVNQSLTFATEPADPDNSWKLPIFGVRLLIHVV